MRTQGWWLNVAKEIPGLPKRYSHYCSIWLGDNRVGEEEKKKAVFLSEQIAGDDKAGTWNFTLSEEWISGKDHQI
jgi:hypothetical protein